MSAPFHPLPSHLFLCLSGFAATCVTLTGWESTTIRWRSSRSRPTTNEPSAKGQKAEEIGAAAGGEKDERNGEEGEKADGKEESRIVGSRTEWTEGPQLSPRLGF